MMTATTESAAAKPPRRVCTAIAGACPLLLLGLYLFMSSVRGKHMYDTFAGRNLGTAVVAYAMVINTVAALLLVGLGMGLWAVVRRERPVWLARIILAVNALLALAAWNAVN